MSLQNAFESARDQDLASVKSKNDYESFYHSISAGLADKVSGIVKDFMAKNPGPIGNSELGDLNQSLAVAMSPYKVSDTMPYISFCPPKSTSYGASCHADSDWGDGGISDDGFVSGFLMRTPYFINDPQRGLVLDIPGWILDYKQVAFSDLNADGMYKALFGNKPAVPKSVSSLEAQVLALLPNNCQAYKTDIAGIASVAMSAIKNVQSQSSGPSAGQSQMTSSGSGR